MEKKEPKKKPIAKEKLAKPVKPTAKQVEIEVLKPIIAEPVLVAAADETDATPVNIEKELAAKPDKYFEATGRRKTAVARVRLFTRGEKQFLVNGKSYQEYFTIPEDQNTVTASMRKMNCMGKFKITVMVSGGGRSAQAEAVRHGTARVLIDFNSNFKKRLRKVGYLTRDPRMRERKKFGLKRARKSPQWAKR